ncbi:hypothetical protein GGS20DRAFT_121531 [Poronia punctata]|nr:hypothetical protein GGS20DRAFT_121531 [Poronia punctata]
MPRAWHFAFAAVLPTRPPVALLFCGMHSRIQATLYFFLICILWGSIGKIRAGKHKGDCQVASDGTGTHMVSANKARRSLLRALTRTRVPMRERRVVQEEEG